MHTPPAKMVRAVETAAELRAAGHPWEHIARQLRRSAETVRRWPRLYPDLWARVAADTSRDLTNEAAGEAVAVLRKLLRSDDEKVRREAARDLLARRPAADAADSPDPANRFHLIADFLGGLTDDDRRRLLDEALAHYAGHHPHDEVAGQAGAGPDGCE